MLKHQMIQKLQKINSFGYKVVQIQQLNIIHNYFSTLHGLKLNLTLQNMQFFGSWQTMYMYLILGLTKKSDIIILSNQIPSKIQECIKSLQRKTIRINLPELKSEKFNKKKEKYNLLLLSNPNLTTGQCPSKDQIMKVCQYCKQKGIIVICDQSMSILCPNQKFYSLMNQNYDKLVVINKIGTLLNQPKLSKYVSFFGSAEIRQSINKSPSKGFKILPNDLIIILIHLQMSQSGLKQRQRQVKTIKINFQVLIKLLIFLKYKITEQQQCKSQYFLLNEGQIQPDVSKYLAEYVPFEKINDVYIRIDLNCETSQFKNGIDRVIQKIPKSKL